MKLKTQLFFIGLIVLALPIIVWQYFVALVSIQYNTKIQALELQARSISQVIKLSEIGSSTMSEVDGGELFIPETQQPIIVDGYDNDWLEVKHHKKSYDNKLTVRSIISQGRLNLFFSINDNDVVFHDPSSELINSGDSLFLSLGEGREKHQYLIRSIAPGVVTSLVEVSSQDGEKQYLPTSYIQSYWTVTSEGSSIEMSLPKPKSGHGLGFHFVDIDKSSISHSISSDDKKIRYYSVELEKSLHPLIQPGIKLVLYNDKGKEFLVIDRLNDEDERQGLIDPKTTSFIDALSYRVITMLLNYSYDNHQSEPLRRSGELLFLDKEDKVTEIETQNGESHILAQFSLEKYLDTDIHALFEFSKNSINAALSSVLVHVFSAFFILTASIIFVLFGYASWLSYRINKIKSATINALKSDGKIDVAIPGGNRGDELGELSRGISQILEQLSSYTEYLRSLSSKLSHELRTPLAVVSTSLENLSIREENDEKLVLIDRARNGVRRLQGLIRDLSEATRLQQSLEHAEYERIEVVAWLSAVIPVYQALYHSYQFNISVPKHAIYIDAAPDLLQQMLEKLLSNAVDFSDEGGIIECRITDSGQFVKLLISNDGPLLDESILSHLFDAMVSYREQKDHQAHLGMGLHIVKLIANEHKAKVAAKNRQDQKGVVIEILFNH